MKFVFQRLLTSLVLGSVLCLLGTATTQDSGQPQSPQPDNTKVNERDRNASAPTAQEQKENGPDRETTQKIRKAIVADKSLSTYAHNVKIITQNGRVTLKGPVQSEEDKKAIEAKAAEVAGESNVTSELQVKP
jgi:hyperosmotically inducible protein